MTRGRLALIVCVVNKVDACPEIGERFTKRKGITKSLLMGTALVTKAHPDLMCGNPSATLANRSPELEARAPPN